MKKVYVIQSGCYEDIVIKKIVSTEERAKKIIEDRIQDLYNIYLNGFDLITYEKAKSLYSDQSLYLIEDSEGRRKLENPLSFDRWYKLSNLTYSQYFFEEADFED